MSGKGHGTRDMGQGGFGNWDQGVMSLANHADNADTQSSLVTRYSSLITYPSLLHPVVVQEIIRAADHQVEP